MFFDDLLFYNNFGCFDNDGIKRYILMKVFVIGFYCFNFIDNILVVYYFVENGIILVLCGFSIEVKEIVIFYINEKLGCCWMWILGLGYGYGVGVIF